MKTIEELGVSRAPWRVGDDGVYYDMVLSAGGHSVAEWMDAKDARLISAAPDLYKVLRDIYVDCLREDLDGGRHSVPARAALEKAGGAE